MRSNPSVNRTCRKRPAGYFGVGHLTMDLLIENTCKFFSLHWNVQELGVAPVWVRWDPFLFGSVPNHERGGCYALFSGENLVYVGLGVSRGGGRYPESGISRRLMSHVYCSDPGKGPRWSRLRDQWSHVTEIRTIGFEAATVYLAPALENYLIRVSIGLSNGRV